MSNPQIKGVHFVGSVPVPSEEDAFRTLSTAFPHQLKRLPDGEPESRDNFVRWQVGVLRQHDLRLVREDLNPEAPTTFSTAEIEDIAQSLRNFETRYDEYAISSYATFKKLKDEGVIQKDVRFQVCLPTPVNVLFCCAHSALRGKIEPAYENAMLRSLRRIQDQIPHSELSIQLDCAVEIGMLEKANFYGRMEMKPWFEPVSDGIVERMARMAESVDADVELGFHLCYGDSGHKHFIEPTSTRNMVSLCDALLNQCKRPINYIHMPVPKQRTDPGYFEPLADLKLQKTELILGLAHYNDFEGTRTRIQTAGDFIDSFSVATECGLGRTPPEQLQDILDTLAAVSSSTSTKR